MLFNDVKEKNGWADKRATNEYKTNIKSCKAHRYENCTTLLQQQRQKQRKTKLINSNVATPQFSMCTSNRGDGELLEIF